MSRSLILGAALSSLIALAALISFVWTPFDHVAMDIPNKLQPPNAANWLGTDQFGRDIFSAIMVGARTSLAVAFVAIAIGMGLGVPLGLWAAARKGGWIDDCSRMDREFAFPNELTRKATNRLEQVLLGVTRSVPRRRRVQPVEVRRQRPCVRASNKRIHLESIAAAAPDRPQPALRCGSEASARTPSSYRSCARRRSLGARAGALRGWQGAGYCLGGGTFSLSPEGATRPTPSTSASDDGGGRALA